MTSKASATTNTIEAEPNVKTNTDQSVADGSPDGMAVGWARLQMTPLPPLDCHVMGWSQRNQRRFMMNQTGGWLGRAHMAGKRA
jgi:hypothetical protein